MWHLRTARHYWRSALESCKRVVGFAVPTDGAAQFGDRQVIHRLINCATYRGVAKGATSPMPTGFSSHQFSNLRSLPPVRDKEPALVRWIGIDVSHMSRGKRFNQSLLVPPGVPFAANPADLG